MAFVESTTAEQSSQPYKYNGKELDEIHGLNWYDYSARHYDAGYITLPTMDPLSEKFFNISPYVYCYNNPMKFVDKDGKQGYLIHGTNASPSRWNQPSVNALMKLTDNKTIDTKFSWEKWNGTFNNLQDRRQAAEALVKYVRKTRVKGEEITLIGHSHGGNVAIQAAKIFYEQTGESVNVITIATPTYQSKKNDLAEDPNTAQGKKAINDHIHIYNSIDGVQGKLAGGKSYDNNKTKNVEIDVSSIYKKSEWLDAHSFDVNNPQLITDQTKNVKLKPTR